MKKTVVIDVVGLTPELIGSHTPRIREFMQRGKLSTIEAAVPAVTTTAQSTYLTGVSPRQHGIVGNGWYFQDEAEIKFWRQSNKLVQHRKLWDDLREEDPSFTVANMFWWYNMYSSVDIAVTPRPMYPADGLKLPDIYTQPLDLRFELQAKLGAFPLFEFWGPNSSINSTQWIADATIEVDKRFDNTLTLVYLPHLDYCLQRHGPDLDAIADDLRDVDRVTGELIDYFTSRDAEIIILSEYGITQVDTPVHLNRAFRERGWIKTRVELERELLDAGVSDAFAVADHQIAHVHVNNPDVYDDVRQLLENTAGVAEVLDKDEQAKYDLAHERSGDFVVLAEPKAWFTYYYWLDDDRAPDFARTVDIHRKPGYDPVELFVDPEIRFPMVKAGYKLLRKKLGFRYLMDLIGLDATLVKGSHGVRTAPSQGPLLISQHHDAPDHIAATDVYDIIRQHITQSAPVRVQS